MNKKMLAVLIVLFLYNSYFVGIVLGQNYSAGVSAGQELYYNSAYFIDNPEGIEFGLPGFTSDLNASWIRLRIESVVVNFVYGNVTFHFGNGTDVIREGWTNVRTGEPGLQVFPVAFFSANLNQGDKVYGSDALASLKESTVNETILRGYASGTRETNHLTTNQTDQETYSTYVDSYFDKQTGITVENNWKSEINSLKIWGWIRLVDTNVWAISDSSTAFTTPIPSPNPSLTPSPSVPEFPAATLVIAVIVATSIGALLLARKQKRVAVPAFAVLLTVCLMFASIVSAVGSSNKFVNLGTNNADEQYKFGTPNEDLIVQLGFGGNDTLYGEGSEGDDVIVQNGGGLNFNPQTQTQTSASSHPPAPVYNVSVSVTVSLSVPLCHFIAYLFVFARGKSGVKF
jgi:hypothetical protein